MGMQHMMPLRQCCLTWAIHTPVSPGQSEHRTSRPLPTPPPVCAGQNLTAPTSVARLLLPPPPPPPPPSLAGWSPYQHMTSSSTGMCRASECQPKASSRESACWLPAQRARSWWSLPSEAALLIVLEFRQGMRCIAPLSQPTLQPSPLSSGLREQSPPCIV